MAEKSSYQKRPLSRILCVDCLPCIPARYVLAMVSCLGFVQVYALRVNLSVAIVQMVNNDSSQHSVSAKVFDWSSVQQGWILSSFFFGYIFTQIPGGWLAARFGGKWVLGVGIVMTAILTLFTPVAANTGVWAIILVRALEGFFEGVTFPAMHAIWAKWAPPLERSRLGTITYAGPHIGNVISFPLSAVLCQYAGWPVVFYVFGSISILWFVLWIWVGFSSPASHPRISEEERNYIETSIREGKKYDEKIPIPWVQILTSPAVWAIIISHFCNNWGFYTLLTCIPSYLKDALPQLSINSAGVVLGGVYSAIPYTLLVIMVLISGQVADFLRVRKILSTTAVRKLFNTASLGGAAIGIVLCGYFGTTTVTSVGLVTLSVGCLGMAFAGFNINHLDIAPRYAGVLMGITNMAATIPGIVGPIVAKAIAHKPAGVPDSPQVYNAYRDEWREVFIISAEIYIFGAITYLLLGSGRKQWWADGVKKRWSLSPESAYDDTQREREEEKEKLLNSDRKDGQVDTGSRYGVVSNGHSIGRSSSSSSTSVSDGDYDFSNTTFKEALN